MNTLKYFWYPINWIIIAVIPSVTTLVLLALFYKPFNPFRADHIFIRGDILEKGPEKTIIRFEQTSTLWDTSDIGEINKPMELFNFQDNGEYQVGDKIIVKGKRIGLLGQIDVYEDYKNHFQATGVDWRTTSWIIFSALTIISVLFSKKVINGKG